MGRGRAKAKQTKVARELKYFSPETDLDRLRAELAGTSSAGNGHRPSSGGEAAVDDALAEDSPDDALAEELQDDEDEDWSARG